MHVSQALSPAAATQHLASQMTRLLLGPEAALGAPRLLRVEARVDTIPPIDWLRAQRRVTQYYWADRGAAFTMAGVGEAEVLAPSAASDLDALFRHMRASLSAREPSLRYYGGFRFSPAAGKGERWRAFKAYRFVVPRFELLERDGGAFLCCNARTGPPKSNEKTLESILEDLRTLRFPDTPEPLTIPHFRQREDHPDFSEWTVLVERALRTCGRGELEKVVLARETNFTADAPIDAASILRKLLDLTQNSFEFCFHPADDRAFIGASPERLFKRTNCYIESEALAGTRPRGKSDITDIALGRELLESEKDLFEHHLVVEAVRENLAAHCRAVNVEPKPSLLRLRNVQHLYTRLEGVLENCTGDTDAALIRTMHPTPAVGGCPRKEALEWLAENESFDRGIFAGPVGWVGFDAAEFCVAIRSALVQGNTISLYNGAGIVLGSIPSEEWAEIESKMAAFSAVLRP